MTGPHVFTCEYCDHHLAVEDTRISASGRVACADTQACDERDGQRWEALVRDLRRRQRGGDELTEAERQILTDQ